VSIRRVVPNIQTEQFEESGAFWSELLGFKLGMDQGWIQTFVSPSNPTAQVSLIRADQSAPVVPGISIEVGNVDAIHAEARRRGLEIVHPLTDEPWGVRRFFVRAPDGTVVNIAAHRPAGAPPIPDATAPEAEAGAEAAPGDEPGDEPGPEAGPQPAVAPAPGTPAPEPGEGPAEAPGAEAGTQQPG